MRPGRQRRRACRSARLVMLAQAMLSTQRPPWVLIVEPTLASEQVQEFMRLLLKPSVLSENTIVIPMGARVEVLAEGAYGSKP